MDTDNLAQLREIFLTQARYCEELDSPFMVRLCRLFARHLQADDATACYLIDLPKPASFWNQALPLRVAGALHALVLSDQCPELKAVYPPHHDEVSDAALWAAVSHAMRKHADFFMAFLDSVPQTNEVRRSCVLLPGFLTIARETGLPFTVSELGASAGINLCWDSFGYQLGDHAWGDPNSGVMMTPDWRGNPPPAAVPITVAERAACDMAPVDFRNANARLRLLSYIWADQADRFTRTENALTILAAKDYTVEKATIDDWLPQRLSRDTTGMVHVICHTITWQYLSEDSDKRSRALIATAGSKATPKAPLAWLHLEPDGKSPGAAITLTLWPDGTQRYLGRADYHGRWIDWSG